MSCNLHDILFGHVFFEKGNPMHGNMGQNTDCDMKTPPPLSVRTATRQIMRTSIFFQRLGRNEEIFLAGIIAIHVLLNENGQQTREGLVFLTRKQIGEIKKFLVVIHKVVMLQQGNVGDLITQLHEVNCFLSFRQENHWKSFVIRSLLSLLNLYTEMAKGKEINNRDYCLQILRTVLEWVAQAIYCMHNQVEVLGEEYTTNTNAEFLDSLLGKWRKMCERNLRIDFRI